MPWIQIWGNGGYGMIWPEGFKLWWSQGFTVVDMCTLE